MTGPLPPGEGAPARTGRLGRRRVLSDPDLDAAIELDGYVVVDDFLNSDQIGELRTELEASLVGDFEGLVFSNEIVDVSARHRVEGAIGRIAGPPLLALLESYRLVASLFVLKLPAGRSRRIWHADPALVDERHFTSISAWCPMVDVDDRNGAFTVACGSHRTVPLVRGGVRVQGLLFPSEPEVEAMCTGERRVLHMHAGQALLYDHRLAHASPPNLTDVPRWAVNVPAIPVEAPLIHYIQEPQGDVDVYELPIDYFYDHDASVPVAMDPSARRVARIDRVTGDWEDVA